MSFNDGLDGNLDKLVNEHCSSIKYLKTEILDKRKEAETCLSTLEEMEQMQLLTDDLRQSFKNALKSAKEAIQDLQTKCEAFYDDGIKKIQEAREEYRKKAEAISGTSFAGEVTSALNQRDSELNDMEQMLEEAMDGVDDDDDSPKVLVKSLRR